jgi:GntR family transcriptional regulator
MMMESREPLYFRIKSDLVRKIRGGEYPVGEEIPTEPELQKEYTASRGTVRRALLELQLEGYLIRRSGKKTIVASTNGRLPVQQSGLSSFSEQVRSVGSNPSTQVLETRLMQAQEAGESVRFGFAVDPTQRLVRVKRLRLRDAVPVAIQSTYLLPERCPGILNGKDLTQLGRLYREEYNVTLTSAEESLSLSSATPDEAELLDIDPGESVVVRDRVSYDETNRPFEVLHSVELPQSFDYRYRIVQDTTKTLGKPDVRLQKNSL